jgi:DNA invertase Pin-like site-specific DNA recombinase
MSLVIFEPERRRMNIYGYCRISTAKQSIDRQIRNIKAEYPTAHIVQEAYTGTSIFRPEWLKLYRVLKEGDTVVFDSVSRMSRNAEEGFALYEDLYHKGIQLVFLKEHHIDTETYKKALSGSIAMTGTNVDFILKGINEYLMALAKEQIKLAFEQSEKEVADLHQRTREGLLTARLNGKQVGRKKGVGFETKKAREAKQIIRTHCKTFGGTLDDMECMKLTGLARNTYYKYKRQIRAELTDEGKLKKEELLCKTKNV